MKSKIICCICMLFFIAGITNAQKKTKGTATGWSYDNQYEKEITIRPDKKPKAPKGKEITIRPDKKPKAPKGFAFIAGGTYIRSDNVDIVPTATDTSMFLRTKSRRMTSQRFFIMKTEVTNKEYRMFTDWVRDSIGLSLLAEKFPDQDYRKYDGTLNWKKREHVKDSIVTCLENDLCYSPKNRITGRLEIDNSKLLYLPTHSLGKMKISEIAIYPDTIVWNEIYYSYSGTMSKNYFRHPAFDEFPVVGVSYYQALAYADWKSKMDGAIVYRLPTETEWEFAAQGTNEGRAISKAYPWNSNLLDDEKGNDFANYGMVKDQNNNVTKFLQERSAKRKKKKHFYEPSIYTTKVKSFPANGYGLYDMAGNAAEWVMDNADCEMQPFYKECEQLPENIDTIENEKKRFIASYGYSFNAFRRNQLARDSAGRLLRDSSGKLMTKKIDSTEFEKILARKVVQFRYSRYYKDIPHCYHYDSSGYQTGEYWGDHAIIMDEPVTHDDVLDQQKNGSIVDISDTVYIVNRWGSYSSQSELYEKLNEIKMRNIEILLTTPDAQIVKGGSWYNGPAYMLISLRQAVAAEKKSVCVGFRLAADVVDKKPD